MFRVLRTRSFAPSKSHPERTSHYKKHIKDSTLTGLTFPLEIDQISKFEANNTDFAINIMRIDDDEEESFAPLYATKYRNRKHLVWLLLLDKGEKRHYILIRDFSRLLHDRNNSRHKIFPCPYCLYCFTTEVGMQNHIDDCGRMGVHKGR